MKRRALLSLLLPGAACCLQAREVQSHGLQFEKWLRDRFFGGDEPQGYTQKWDIPASANLDHGGIPVNPKAAKYGSPIGLGDALRQWEIAEPFLLIVGFWDQVTATDKAWVNVQAVRVEPTSWRQLWGGLKREHLDSLVEVIKDKSLSLEEARRQVQALKNQPTFPSSILVLNPKIDRSQRRLQCSLRFQDFFHHLAPSASSARLSSPTVFGVPVPQQFESPARVITPER